MGKDFHNRLTISVAEMAEALGISRPTAYEVLRRPDCDAALKIGRRTLVSVDRLRKWLLLQADGYKVTA